MTDRNETTKPQPKPASQPKVDYPHDETYTPGYHEGGSRFGFFNGNDNAGAPVAPKGPKAPAKP